MGPQVTVDGEQVPVRGSFVVVNPATGREFATAPAEFTQLQAIRRPKEA